MPLTFYEPDLLKKMRLAFDAARKHLSNEVAESETWRLNLARRVFLHVEHGERDPCTLAFLAAEDLRMQHPLLPGLKPAHTAKKVASKNQNEKQISRTRNAMSRDSSVNEKKFRIGILGAGNKVGAAQRGRRS
jgi:hypothetical protein